MGKTTVTYHLIPDGTTTIVKVTIDSEFNVDTNGAVKAAEDGIVQIVARLTGNSIEHVRNEVSNFKWFGDTERPDEP